MQVIYSKLKNKNWPRPAYILKKLSSKVPRGNLVVQLFDDDETKVTEDEKPVRFEELKVKLQCQFSGSRAGELLKQEVAEMEAA